MNKIAVAAKILIAANIVVWGAPTALFLFLDFYQFSHGNGSFALLAIGPLPLGVGLVLSTYCPTKLIKAGHLLSARGLGVCFLLLGLPLAAFSVMLLGST